MNATDESRERGAQLTTRIAQRAVTGAKLAAVLRDCQRLLRYNADYANERATVLATVSAALAEWESLA